MTQPISESVKNRFWSKVHKTDSCWLWTAYTDPDGYGRIRFDGRAYLAHRLSLLLAGKMVPDGLEPDHTCRNPACVNPDHLEPVTHKINSLRGAGVGSENAAKTHCIRGHELSGDNLADWPSMKGKRRCRICTALSARAAYLRRKKGAA